MSEYKSFKEFYPFYLSQHQNRTCRRMHFTGTSLVLICIAVACLTRNFYWLLLLPFIGYGFAWLGHYVYEKNRPATFTHPFYSLMADFVLFKDMLLRKQR